MSSVKISIVIPAFNSENYIAKCIDSIVNQTLKDIEIIIVMMLQKIILKRL